MLAQARESWADLHARDGVEIYKVDHVYVAVLRCDVGVEAQAGTKERWAMLARDDDRGADEQGGDEDDYANVFAAAHLGGVAERGWGG